MDLLEGGSARKSRRRYRPKILTGSLKKRKQEVRLVAISKGLSL